MPQQYDNTPIYQPWMIIVTWNPLTLSMYGSNQLHSEKGAPKTHCLFNTPQVDPNIVALIPTYL